MKQLLWSKLLFCVSSVGATPIFSDMRMQYIQSYIFDPASLKKQFYVGSGIAEGNKRGREEYAIFGQEKRQKTHFPIMQGKMCTA